MLYHLVHNTRSIPLIFEQDLSLPIVIFKLSFQRSGKAYEEQVGACKMLARVLNEGADLDFFKELELRAINFYASASFESFDLHITCLKEHFAFALSKLEALLKKPRYDEKLLLRLKNIALGELANKSSDFDYLAKNLLNKSVFEYEEFKYPGDGDEKSIKSLNLKHLQDFFNTHLCLENLLIQAGGDLSLKELESSLEGVFACLKEGKGAKLKHFDFCKENKDEKLVKKESEQAYIYFASPFKASFKDKDLYLAKLAFFILGAGGFGSRLMEEVRVKRGLAYSAYAMLDMNLSFTRVFGYLQTKNENATMAKELVRGIFSDFVAKGVSELELKLAQNFLIGSNPLRYESLEKRLALALSEFYQGFEIGHFKQELVKIKNADLKSLNAYIKKHGEIANLSFASVQNEL